MTWLLARSAGIGAFLALYLSVAWGLLSTTSLVTKRISKRSSIVLHASVATAGLVLLALHLTGLALDRFVRFDVLDFVVPARAAYRPFATGLGVLAMYATVIVLASSWVRRGLRPALWRAIHLLAVPAFAMALLHGLLAGSDAARPALADLYGLAGLSVLFLLLVRAFTARPARRSASPRPQRTSVGREGAPDRPDRRSVPEPVLSADT